MSDIVSVVLKYTFGFLANTIRKEVAERLKDGDVTDEECRRLIVRELDDIKSKLDGLARKDLLSSVCFLKEGINGLYQLQLELPSDENIVESTEGVTLVEASSSRNIGSDPSSSMNEAVALVSAVTLLKLHSNAHFKSAIESFKLAREKATEAFCNEALSIEDRIQASQIRTMARILEKLEHPDSSVSDCLQYLQELHDVVAIREIFSVLIDGGFKSWFNQTMRLNNVSSVQDMNVILFNFARKFTKLMIGSFDWPTISVGGEIYNPLFGEKRNALVGKIERAGAQLSSLCPDFLFDNNISPEHSVVNSKGQIVAKLLATNTIKIFKRSGESRTVCEVPMEEQATKWKVTAMDIDAEDNIYVITAFRKSDGPWSFKLFIFDENGKKKLETPLFFLQSPFDPIVRMAISKDGRVAIFNYAGILVSVGKVCVEMNSFEVEQRLPVMPQIPYEYPMSTKLQISDVNGTKIIVNDFATIYIYIDEKLKRIIDIPYEYSIIKSLAIDHTTNGIVFKSKSGLSSKKHILGSFSETGKILYSLSLDSSKWGEDTNLTSHPNGAVVLVGETEAMLIKGQMK